MGAHSHCSLSAIAVAVRLVAASALISACHPSQAAAEGTKLPTPAGQVWLKPAEVRDAKIEVQSIGPQVVEDSVLTSGVVTLDDQRSAHVFTPVTGRVIKILAELGQQVKKGDPLAIIESPDVGSAVSDAHKAEADLIAADHSLRRKKELFDAQAASAADVEASEDTYRNAKAELERARQKQFLLRVGNVDAVTQSYTLTAPIDGEILLRNITPGVEVQGQYAGGATQELFTIGELDRVWVLGDVYEVDIGRVHVGTPAKVTVPAYPDKVFEGRVDWVSGGLDAVTRTARVRCTFENPDELLRPSMYATVRITVDERKALAVPAVALLRLGEYTMVFVQIGELDGFVRYERLPVEVVDGEGPWLEVTHGLDLGQQVVVSGAANLSQKI
jgi:cobalt-zinc-cadmium efflux system membrane fusion protein